MAFKGNPENLPKPEDINRCQYGGNNNRKSTGGCGKHVVKTGQMVKSKLTGDTWHIWHHFDYCKDHFDLETHPNKDLLPVLEV